MDTPKCMPKKESLKLVSVHAQRRLFAFCLLYSTVPVGGTNYSPHFFEPVRRATESQGFAW
jgi:hypothetical protein